VGLDTVEVANALNVLGYEELSYSVIRKGENGIIVPFTRGSVQLMKDLKLERYTYTRLAFISVSGERSP